MVTGSSGRRRSSTDVGVISLQATLPIATKARSVATFFRIT
jgi:hypothetical protein